MGLHQLNKFLKTHSQNSMQQCNFMFMRNKTVAIDTNLYMHLFKRDNHLMINMYWLITLFKNNKINMIFVFDGAPPPEKMHILKKRREKKIESNKKIKQLEQSINSKNIYDVNLQIKKEMKNAVYITKHEINNVKSLINAYGMSYINAEGEADKLCAQLVNNNIVDACLSEDMDLVLYGTHTIIRCIDLMEETFMVYKYNKILDDLSLTSEEFKYLCVIGGTDYNRRHLSVYKAYTDYKNQSSKNTFITFINNHLKLDEQHINNTINLFNVNVNYTYKLNKGKFDIEQLTNIMKENNIIYLT